MNITKEQWIAIGKIVLAAVLAIMAVFGYDLGVIQPREATRIARQVGVPIGSQALGTGRFTNLIATTITTTNLVSQSVGFNASSLIVGTSGLTVSQGITSNGYLDMKNNTIQNVGSASTDFNENGGLTLAQALTATGHISAAGGTLAGALNMFNNVISNIGNASTDFDSAGGLSLAGALTVTGQITTNKIYIGKNYFTGPVIVVSGTVQNGGTIAHGLSASPTYAVCAPFGPGIVTATVFISGTPGASNLVIGLGDALNNVYWPGSLVVNCMVIP